MKKYLYTALFFAVPVLCAVSCQYGCSSLPDTPAGQMAKSVLKESAFAAAVIGLDLVAEDVKEVAAVKDALTMDLVGAFESSDQPKEIAKNLAERASLTALSEVSRRLLLSGIRDSLTGEGVGQVGSNAPPEQMAFNEALAGAL